MKKLNFEIKKISENNYENILNMFIGNDVMRSWMSSPFNYGEYSVSTDAHRMCYIQKSKTIPYEFYDLKSGSGFSVTSKRVPTGYLKISDYQECKIGVSFFNTKFIKDIISVAEYLKIEDVFVMQTEMYKHSDFKIGDVNLIIMPMMQQDDFKFEVKFEN